MGSVWDWLMVMFFIRVASNFMYVGVGLQLVACQVGPGISCQGIACQVWAQHQLPGLCFSVDIAVVGVCECGARHLLPGRLIVFCLSLLCVCFYFVSPKSTNYA